ncbi:MAG: serine hydrolase [Candidatus Omnitrophota bacterium]
MKSASFGKIRAKTFLAVLCCALGVGGTGYYTCQKHLAVVEARKAEQRKLEQRRNAWLKLEREIKAQAVSNKVSAGIVVRDLTTGWETGVSRGRRIPAASLSKIPLMLACYKAVEEGKMRLEDIVVLKGRQKTGGSGILKNASAGTKITIERLIELMMTHSDNTAANILMERLGAGYINVSFRGFGLAETKLRRKMMDFTLRRKGIENYTTAGEMAELLDGIYHGRFLDRGISQRCLCLLKNQKYNDRLPARLPTSVVVAHKTGLERKVCHDVGILFTSKGDFIVCVLTQGAQSSKEAKRFIANVAFLVYRYAESL